MGRIGALTPSAALTTIWDEQTMAESKYKPVAPYGSCRSCGVRFPQVLKRGCARAYCSESWPARAANERCRMKLPNERQLDRIERKLDLILEALAEGDTDESDEAVEVVTMDGRRHRVDSRSDTL